MGAYYDEVEIEDMAWDEEKRVYHYPCPCGDRFEISKKQLKNYEDVATCPSCSLIIRVIFDPVSVLLYIAWRRICVARRMGSVRKLWLHEPVRGERPWGYGICSAGRISEHVLRSL